MNKNNYYYTKYACFFLIIGLIIVLTGCGKHETSGSVMGTATGALLGASLAGKHSKGSGALIGGLVGNMLGGSVGRGADEEER